MGPHFGYAYAAGDHRYRFAPGIICLGLLSFSKQFSAALLLAASGAFGASEAVSPPDVEFTATPARDIAKRREDVQVVIRLTNKSAIGCSNVKITLVSPDFMLRNTVTIPSLAPFGSETKQVTIGVLDSANFTSHHPVL